MPRTLIWVVVALVGLVVAAGVTAAASRLSSQRVGLASEPLSAGERLAPGSGRSASTETIRPARPRPAHKRASPPATTTPSQGGSTTAPTTTVPPVQPGADDSGEGGKGSGKSGEGDD